MCQRHAGSGPRGLRDNFRGGGTSKVSQNHRRMTALEQAILVALRKHPHHDTPAQLLDILHGPEVDGERLADALERLRADGAVHTDGGHWQLTAFGFRLQRQAA